MPGGVAPFLPIFIVVVESGALYATSVLALIVTLFTEYGVQCAVLDIVVPIVVSLLGLHKSWLIARLSLGD